MKYKCKVLTIFFYTKLNNYLDTNFNKNDKEVVYKLLMSYWRDNNNTIPSKLKELLSDFLIPEYIEHVYDKYDSGYQTSPRIKYNEEIVKIDEVNLIFSYSLTH